MSHNEHKIRNVILYIEHGKRIFCYEHLSVALGYRAGFPLNMATKCINRQRQKAVCREKIVITRFKILNA